jgi:ubiquinone/menaquinone biosynthesis C-methylase UbiE
MATGEGGALTPQQARGVYNRLGRMQDWQRFYEAPPVKDLFEHGEFDSARRVFELGCGTGAFARELLDDHLAPAATYRGVDVSDTMVRLASGRLAPWVERADVRQVDGSLPLPGEDGGFDRFVAAYVFDLLDAEYTAGILSEASRLLATGGRLCIVGLTPGTTPISKAVSRGWQWLWARAPWVVGGCRPTSLEPGQTWRILHRRVVTAWGVPSEVVVATPVRRD